MFLLVCRCEQNQYTMEFLLSTVALRRRKEEKVVDDS